MKLKQFIIPFATLIAALFIAAGCSNKLDELPENRTFTGETDYTIGGNMIQPLLGSYVDFNETQWEDFPLIAVRGDDVNAGGLGDQQDLSEADNYRYNKDSLDKLIKVAADWGSINKVPLICFAAKEITAL